MKLNAARAPIAIPAIAGSDNPPDEFVLDATVALVLVISVSVAGALFKEVLVLARLKVVGAAMVLVFACIMSSNSSSFLLHFARLWFTPSSAPHCHSSPSHF